MRKLWIIIGLLYLSLSINGCDGYTKRITKIDLGKNKPVSYVASISKDNHDLQNLFKLIEKVALSNGLTCNPYSEQEHYFGCGIGSFNLMTYIKSENIVQIELTEFGPWGKTKRFERLERDLNVMFNEEFPGEGYMLRKKR